MDWKGIAKEILSTIAIVAVIVGVGIAITGAWPFMVAVQSCSMEPHIHKGDVVILFGLSRVGKVVTWIDGHENNYMMFGDYGDVVVYRPNGNNGETPIIHRVLAYVHRGEYIPILIKINGKEYLGYVKVKAKVSGFITQGDANYELCKIQDLKNLLIYNYILLYNKSKKRFDKVYLSDLTKFKVCKLGIPDQLAPGWNIEPVKMEWIVGVAKFRVPYIGWIRLLI
ncbi:S26 family signal peptidase [Archaeoglobus sp.]